MQIDPGNQADETAALLDDRDMVCAKIGNSIVKAGRRHRGSRSVPVMATRTGSRKARLRHAVDGQQQIGFVDDADHLPSSSTGNCETS